MIRRIILAAWLGLSFGASAQFQNQVIVCDKTVPNQCQGVDNTGAAKVAATINVSGAADLPGNTSTFSANNVCTAVLTAGEQSVGFHLDSGTLAATLTAFGTQATGAVNCASAGTCTALTFSSGATIIVTNPNGVKDVGVVAQPGMRQVEVCTTSFTSGTATGVVTATYLNATSSGSGGGTVIQGAPNSAANAWPVAETFSGSLIDPRAIRALTVADIVGLGAGSAIVGKFGIDQTTPGTTNGVVVNSLPATPAGTNLIGKFGIDQTTPGTTNGVVLTQTATAQGGGTPGANGGFGLLGIQGPDLPANANPVSIATFGSSTVSSVRAPSFASATNLTTACTTATACSPTTGSIQWSVNGQAGAEVVITAVASPVGFTLACDTGYDNNATYLLGDCGFAQAGVFKTTLANADLVAGNKFALIWLGSPSFVRIRVTAVSSGQFTAAGAASTATGLPFPVEAKPPSQNAITLTASTAETTLLAAGGSGVFLDLTELSCSTTSATGNVITIRPATGATCPTTAGCRTIVCPASTSGTPCEGWVWKVPWTQAASNNNWTAQASGSTSSVMCEVQAVRR